jgi:hypothetical protein
MITFAPGPKTYRSNLSMATSRRMDEMSKAIEANEIPNADHIDFPRCPRCHSRLLHNGVHVWCSFVGGGWEKACSFGLDYDVSIDGLSAVIEHESQPPTDPTGVPVFGHTQVDEALRLWRNMLPQERPQAPTKSEK